MQRFFTFMIAWFFIFPLKSQSFDANWLYGYTDTLYGSMCGKVMVHHTDGGLEEIAVDSPLNFGRTMAAISDSSGSLVLYTNGCAIANGDHEIIGDGLNPGELHDRLCPGYGYNVPYGTYILPFPGSDKMYAVIHLASAMDMTTRFIKYDKLYYSIVDMKADGGRGAIIEKNVLLREGDMESVAVVRHGNGRDWWIFVPEYNSDIYHRYLLSPEGFEEYDDIVTGFDFPQEICNYSANSMFSPDGTRYVRANTNCGFVAFDFDRCTGEIFNPIYNEYHFSRYVSHSNIAIVPGNIMYIYLPRSYDKDIPRRHFKRYYWDWFLKIDMDLLGVEANFIEKRFKFTEEESVCKPYAFFSYNNGDLFYFDREEDGMFYRIPNAGIKGEEIKKEKLGNTIARNSMTIPAFPDYLLGAMEGSACDTLTSAVTMQSAGLTARIYPNPVTGRLNILINDDDEYTVTIYNTNSFAVMKAKIDTTDEYYGNWDISGLPAGIYIVELKSRDKVIRQKIIKL